MVVAYAIGLGMANVAVYVMKMGQPALLYLVPCCLGTMVGLGWHRHELRQLWEGPKVLETAEAIVFGTTRLPKAPTTIESPDGLNLDNGGATSNQGTTSNVDLGRSNQTSMTAVAADSHHNVAAADDDDEMDGEDDETGHLPLLHRQQEKGNGDVGVL